MWLGGLKIPRSPGLLGKDIFLALGKLPDDLKEQVAKMDKFNFCYTLKYIFFVQTRIYRASNLLYNSFYYVLQSKIVFFLTLFFFVSN